MKNDSFIRDLKIIIKKNYPKRFLLIFIASWISAFLEMISLGTIPLFVGFILSPQIFIEQIPFDNLRIYLENYDESNLILFGATLVLAAFLFKNFFLTLLIFFEYRTIYFIRRDISSKMYKHYVYLPYELSLDMNPAKLSRNIVTEIKNSISVLLLGFSFVREILVVSAIVFLLFFQSPITTLFTIIALIISVSIFYILIRNKLIFRAKENILIQEKVIRTINETFSSLKNLKILLKEKFAVKFFRQNMDIYEKNLFFLEFTNRFPKIFLETISIIMLVSIIFYFIKTDNEINNILPILSLLAVAAVRLVPSFNSITIALNNFKAKGPSLKLIAQEIMNIEKFRSDKKINNSELLINFPFDNLEIKNISYKYPNTNRNVIENVSLSIKNGTIIGLVGKTGSGKSTLFNLMLGLLKPYSGTITLNKSNINENIYKWRQYVGYISQDVFLNDDTIKHNITLSDNDEEINENNLKNALNISELEDFVTELPNGLLTKVGRDGIRLSGGQKQRVAIARSIYRKPKVLFMDEATSALDDKTEANILIKIKKSYDNFGAVFISSHREKTLDSCDQVYQLKDKTIFEKKI